MAYINVRINNTDGD